MGSLMAEKLGASYRAIGTAFHHGTYLSAPGSREGQERSRSRTSRDLTGS